MLPDHAATGRAVNAGPKLTPLCRLGSGGRGNTHLMESAAMARWGRKRNLGRERAHRSLLDSAEAGLPSVHGLGHEQSAGG